MIIGGGFFCPACLYGNLLRVCRYAVYCFRQGKDLGNASDITLFRISFYPGAYRVEGLSPFLHHHFINYRDSFIPEYVPEVLINCYIDCLQEAEETDHENHYGNKEFNQRETLSVIYHHKRSHFSCRG